MRAVPMGTSGFTVKRWRCQHWGKQFLVQHQQSDKSHNCDEPVFAEPCNIVPYIVRARASVHINLLCTLAAGAALSLPDSLNRLPVRVYKIQCMLVM